MAHRITLDSKDFDELILRISSFEEIAISWLVPQTFNIRAAIKKLVEGVDQHPSEEGLDAIEKLIGQPVELDYFFEIIESPRLASLFWKAKTTLTVHLNPVRESEYVRFPDWPLFQYLMRVADKRPKEVVNIIKCICKTWNCQNSVSIISKQP